MKKIFLAVIIGTLVGCTDYLDKYQDEAIIAAENTDDEISSSSESDALSSANVESSSSAVSSSSAKDVSSSSVAASSSSEAVSSSSEEPASSSAESSSSEAVSSSSEEPASSSAESSSSESASSSSVAISSSSEEPASSSAESSSSTSGYEVTECDGDSIFVNGNSYTGYGLAKKVGLSKVHNVDFSANSEYFYVFDPSDNKTPFDISSWEGLCIEYTTSAEFNVNLRYANTNTIGSSSYSVITIPPTSSRTARVWEWKEFSRNGVLRAQMTSLLQFSLPYKGSTPNATIYKITTKTKSGKTSSIAKLDSAKSITVGKVKWDLNSPNETTNLIYSYEDAFKQCGSLGKRLPTTDEWKNLFEKFGDNATVPTFTYEFLFSNIPLTGFSYVDFSKNEVKETRAFWTNNMDLFEFYGDLKSLRLNYLPREQDTYKNAVAEFRCVEDVK